MGIEDFDVSQFIEPFIETAKERLLKLEEGFLKLEKDEADKSLLGELLREAHTLKGEARMLGLNEISNTAHHLEDFLVEIRDKRKEPASVVDDLFEKLEELKQLINKIGKEEKGKGIEETSPRETIRIKVGLLEKVANLSLETVLNFKQIEKNNFYLRRLLKNSSEIKEEWEDIKRTIKATEIEVSEKISYFQQILYELFDYLREIWNKYEIILATQALISEELLMQSLSSRMLPLSTIFDLYPGKMRNMAKEIGKKINFEVKGGEIELDKAIIEEINDPLIHILRNALDHGIEDPLVRQRKGKPEEGTISLRATQREGKVIIEVEDDGEGLNLDKIKKEALKKGIILDEDIKEIAGEVPPAILETISHSGFSTKGSITSISGRGVGLDAVKNTVENLNGTLRIFSYPDKGTKFVLELPLTIALLPAILVKASNQIFALPTQWIEAVLEVKTDDIKQLKNQKLIEINNQPVSLFDLNQAVGFSPLKISEAKSQVVVIKHNHQLCAFAVEEIIDQREIIVKPLSKYLDTRLAIGASILENGGIVLILNTSELLKSTPAYTTSFLETKMPARKGKIKVLAVDDALITRTLLKNILLSAGYEVTTAINGLDALQKLAQSKFDIIVTDVEMPRMDGLQLTAQVKKHEQFKNIPVIIVSSHETEEEKMRGLEAGADAYLPKSTFSQQMLIETIERLVE
ncbi:MAG: response regulator [Candidatus Desulfofervidaceae bacterium]|nr:response regulator [Candidatus Desulfofervidaceae bacterium]MDL1970411.1 response regulator [Candidatus Desulfofervidaceae bacterium]